MTVTDIADDTWTDDAGGTWTANGAVELVIWEALEGYFIVRRL